MINKDEETLFFLLADDHTLIRQGMVFLLDAAGINYKAFHASNFQQIKDCLHTEVIHIAIIDAYFPEGNSLQIISEIKEKNPDIKILIFSGIDENVHALKYLNAGADGFLSKLSEEEEIKHAILTLIDKGEYISPVTRTLLMNSLNNRNLINPLSSLTQKELEIARMYSEGFGNLEIANRLEVKQNTISTIKKRIFKKLNIENIVELIELMKNHS
ncbi:response regulator transcription factor [Chryseobacterium salviniae]|uniref:Response regulator transcription factor n=1 Tax=Chryseobacterium salviniae TaxID=3101750 RepID=A0ABU6HX35_9FLAO|nr:response regulator transcription factor [Chryseobacterium sp. T9W2-O]MEC3877413.1 response regulator transcription factor [Chryseobacterium sp. T9W2-O]